MSLLMKLACVTVSALMIAACSKQDPIPEPPREPVASAEVCDGLNAKIDEGIREIAVASFQNYSVTSQMQVLQMNVGLLAQNHCPPRTTPIDPLGYDTEYVLRCSSAQIARQLSKGPDGFLDRNLASACDIRQWKPAR